MSSNNTPSRPKSALEHRVERDGKIVRVFLDGEVDMRISPHLRAILHDLIEQSPDAIHVDLSKVPFIDSSGVATFVEALRLLMKRKRKLVLEKPSEAVLYTLRITQLHKVFGLEEE